MEKLVKSISCPSYIYIDDLNNVICESAFTVVIGKIDSKYNFVPKSNLVLDQGLTPQMLIVISGLITEKHEKDNLKDNVK